MVGDAMDADSAWDWEVKYKLGASKDCGALGRTSSKAKALERVTEVLTSLPPRTIARGHILLMGSVPALGDRAQIRIVATVERTQDGQILWNEPD